MSTYPFWRRVRNVNGPGCWEWDGAVTNVGYGVFQHERVRYYAHRYAWTRVNGPLPDGMVVRHTCDNPRCVRPSHLLLGTKADNSRDMVERGRSTRKTHCVRGHPLTDENRYQRPDRPGRSDCLLCNRIRARQQKLTPKNAPDWVRVNGLPA